MPKGRPVFSIYIDTIHGPVPAWHDGQGYPVVYETHLEAEREIADTIITRLTEFLEGMREFEDAIAVDDYIVAVDLLPDGLIVDEAGNHFVRISV